MTRIASDAYDGRGTGALVLQMIGNALCAVRDHPDIDRLRIARLWIAQAAAAVRTPTADDLSIRDRARNAALEAVLEEIQDGFRSGAGGCARHGSRGSRQRH